jgi:hypothetical protein
MGNDFAKKSSGCDEWFTPKYAVIPILKYIPKSSKIWCPFDTDKSLFVQTMIEEGYDVVYTHIDTGNDFFNTEVPNCDYIVSNPPYSIRNKILERLFEIDKPFAMLMNSNGLFDSRIRWNLFKNNEFGLIYLNKRVNYIKEYGKLEKSSPPFQSVYITHGIINEKIVFEEINT